MDELDLLILKTLQENGRLPFTHIAQKAGVSETTIRTRYQKLVDDGVCRTVAIADPHELGFLAPAIICIKVEPGVMDIVANAIAELPEVSYLVLTLGFSDLIVEVFCRDLQHLTELCMDRIQRIQGVQSTETLVIGKSYKLSYRWTPVVEME